jgi:hypothetical protein
MKERRATMTNETKPNKRGPGRPQKTKPGAGPSGVSAARWTELRAAIESADDAEAAKLGESLGLSDAQLALCREAVAEHQRLQELANNGPESLDEVLTQRRALGLARGIKPTSVPQCETLAAELRDLEKRVAEAEARDRAAQVASDGLAGIYHRLGPLFGVPPGQYSELAILPPDLFNICLSSGLNPVDPLGPPPAKPTPSVKLVAG